MYCYACSTCGNHTDDDCDNDIGYEYDSEIGCRNWFKKEEKNNGWISCISRCTAFDEREKEIERLTHVDQNLCNCDVCIGKRVARMKEQAGGDRGMSVEMTIKDMVLSEAKKGNVVVATIEGFSKCPVKTIIEQPTQGLLYDLNRLPEVVLSWIYDPKWVNDYAVQMVINELKYQLEESKKLVEKKDRIIKEFKNSITPEHFYTGRIILKEISAAEKAVAEREGKDE